MNDELRKLILNENVPMSLEEELHRKMEALAARARELSSKMSKAQSFCEGLGLMDQMFKIQEESKKAKADFIKEARKYVKKGGMSDGRE